MYVGACLLLMRSGKNIWEQSEGNDVGVCGIWNGTQCSYIELVALHNLGRRTVCVVVSLIVLVPFKSLRGGAKTQITHLHALPQTAEWYNCNCVLSNSSVGNVWSFKFIPDLMQ